MNAITIKDASNPEAIKDWIAGKPLPPPPPPDDGEACELRMPCDD